MSCLCSYFLESVWPKDRREGSVLGQQEGAQVWDPDFPGHWRGLRAPYLRSPLLASWVCVGELQLSLRL